MKTSEVIKLLQVNLEKYGELEIQVEDPSSFPMPFAGVVTRTDKLGRPVDAILCDAEALEMYETDEVLAT